MNRGKILIVDDEAEIRKVMAAFFGRKGFDAVAVESGMIGLDILAQEKFDCLISDIRMPFMDGIEFARRAREIDYDLAIILLTGYGSLESAQEAILSGIQGYLTKPVDLDKLQKTVEEVLKKIGARRMDAGRYKKLEEQLEKDKQKLDSMKTELTTLISHELRTPVAVITESFSLLKDAITSPIDEKREAFSEDDKGRLLEFLEHGHRRLITVIEDISYYINLKNKSTAFRPSEVVLAEFLEGSFSAFERLISGSNASLKKELSKEKYLANIDKEKFLDLLARLINNSMRHNPMGVEISLKLNFIKRSVGEAREGDFARIEILDNGKGIEEGALERLFNPFTVADIAVHTKGIGLGLAISKEVVDLHKGTISVQNRDEKGVIVAIDIPAFRARG